MQLILYTGPQCSLCEDAKELIYPLLPASARLQEVDVTLNLETKKNYGLRIPVLFCKDTGAELAWPFSADEITRFLIALD